MRPSLTVSLLRLTVVDRCLQLDIRIQNIKNDTTLALSDKEAARPYNPPYKPCDLTYIKSPAVRYCHAQPKAEFLVTARIGAPFIVQHMFSYLNCNLT
jgi:hypothetical protein